MDIQPITLDPLKKSKKHVDIKEDVDVDELWRMCRICTDYHHNNPFSDEEDEDDTLLSMEEVYAIIARDELTSLKDAKNGLNGNEPCKNNWIY